MLAAPMLARLQILLAWMVALALAGNCSFYTLDKNSVCPHQCGSCFNPGSRSGVLCKGQQTGYYCPADSPQAGGGMAYACMDWTFGSTAMKSAEASFNKGSSSPVSFGVGSFGSSSDPMRGLGACFRLSASGVGRELIVQSINTGSDVAGNQFDLQVGDGGTGAYNTCAGGGSAMFPGDKSVWGHQYGGVDTRAQCDGLPVYPKDSAAMKAANDSLVELCRASFDARLRLETSSSFLTSGIGTIESNPTIQSITRVKCPAELVELTQIQRSDEPATFTVTAESDTMVKPAAHKCQASSPGAGNAWCLTRMMDCRKPSGGFKDNVVPALVVDKHRLVQPCTANGYTRIDVQCGCTNCYC